MAKRQVWRHRTVMWSTVGGSGALLSVLLLLGVGRGAWTIAAAVLLLSCVAVCVVSVWQGAVAEREVKHAVDDLAARRSKLDRTRREYTGPE